MNVAICPGARMVVGPEHVPVGELRDWQVGRDAAGGRRRDVSDADTRSVTFPVFVTVKV